MDTQSRIKTNICHCPKTEGGFRGEGRGLWSRDGGGWKMDRCIKTCSPSPSPSRALWCIEEGRRASSVSLAMNHGTRSIRTPLFFPFLISGWTERNASYLGATIHTHTLESGLVVWSSDDVVMNDDAHALKINQKCRLVEKFTTYEWPSSLSRPFNSTRALFRIKHTCRLHP